MQKIVVDYPPNYEELVKVFPIKGKAVIFSWGNLIYNPDNILIQRFLKVHEAVHGSRQLGDIDGWWRRYIDEPDFRLNEELLAHAAEQKFRLASAYNRQDRRAILAQTAKRLASPLYGPVIGKKKALAALKELSSA